MNFNRRPPKSEVIDKSDFIFHDIYGLGGLIISPTWYERNDIVCISIDPGVVNLCIRIERRSFKNGNINVEVLHHENVSFRKYVRIESVSPNNSPNDRSISRLGINGVVAVSQLYGEIIKYIDKFKDILPEVNIVVIEKQLAVNYQSVRISQHLISIFQVLLANSKYRPWILEINSKVKSNLFAPNGINDKQIKAWAIEKALQLCFLRQDWQSFDSIIDAPRKKSDDLSDTIVQLEALCSALHLPVCPIPPGWDNINTYVGWQSGMIFFRDLIDLLGEKELATGIKGWLSIIKRNRHRIIQLRRGYRIDNESNKLLPIQRTIVNVNNGRIIIESNSSDQSNDSLSTVDQTLNNSSLNEGVKSEPKIKLIIGQG